MNIRKQVNEKIIAAFRQEIVPWYNNHGVYTNVMFKEKFNGVNPLLLGLAAKEHGFKSRWWGSASQINLRPGSSETEIVIYKQGMFGTKLDKTSVYNLDQTVGNKNRKQAPRYNDMERLIRSVNVEFKVVPQKVAYYRYPPRDWIEIPPKEWFIKGLDSYYETIAHELMHWTEIKLGWENDANKYPRAVRELRAEMGSGFLMTELCIPHSTSTLNFRNHIDEWIGYMRKDHTLIFRTAVSACKAADCLLALINANTKRFNYIEERVA